MRKCTLLMILLISFCVAIPIAFADNQPYHGFPQRAVLQVSNLDDTGGLIYVGIDFAVFQDIDKDGIFQVKEKKVKRIITKNTTITIDLGDSSDYQKGIHYKLAMRTLYYPVGVEGNAEIVIADYDNGKEGWILIPGSEFIPSYFPDPGKVNFIEHTEKWDQNRILYNESKIAAGKEEYVRPYSTFWSGEKFILNIPTTEAVPAIKITIKGTDYTAILTDAGIVSGGAIYKGELWDADMLNKWGNYNPKELTFIIEAMDEKNETLETIETEITMDNKELFYRVRRVY